VLHVGVLLCWVIAQAPRRGCISTRALGPVCQGIVRHAVPAVARLLPFTDLDPLVLSVQDRRPVIASHWAKDKLAAGVKNFGGTAETSAEAFAMGFGASPCHGAAQGGRTDSHTWNVVNRVLHVGVLLCRVIAQAPRRGCISTPGVCRSRGTQGAIPCWHDAQTLFEWLNELTEGLAKVVLYCMWLRFS
jgi:hypothetical protein